MARIWNKHKQTNTPLKRKVFVAMSGGVDSSVAAALLQERGFDIVGVHMKCWSGNIAAPQKRGEPRLFNNRRDGCGEKDAEDARRVAEQLKIPFYVFDLEKEYKEKVVDYMIDGYRKGLTPNPDVMCNKEIKFGLFLKRALELGADYVATGHYVRLLLEASSWKLVAARDRAKDQSYFLWTLTQAQLKHCLFPIGDYTKPQVRRLAKKFNLLTAEKKDSQGVCFLGQIKLADFLSNYIKPKVGQVRLVQNDSSFKIIGKHHGAYSYTIGQRSGLGIGGAKKPLYVIDKNIKKNLITVAEGNDNPVLYKKEIYLNNVNFLNPIPDTRYPIPVLVRVRYRQPLIKATLTNANNRQNYAESVRVIFEKDQKFIASGQSAVFYNGRGQLLGGGVII